MRRPLLASLKGLLRRLARKLRRMTRKRPLLPLSTPAPGETADPAYQKRIESELRQFAEQVNVHELPAIYHYWSNRYIRPMLNEIGWDHPYHAFVFPIIAACRNYPERQVRVVSLGAGNCDTEVWVAEQVVAAGHRNFVIECLDLNPHMLERGKAMALAQGVADQVKPLQGDFNRWRAATPGSYDVAMANQSLHHVMELEHLFAAVKEALREDGRFATSDMIGRNGHMRWPEALRIVEEIWAELPMARRYNLLLERPEPEFVNWDCAVDGFEGIRAQDILPLLLKQFHFTHFIAFANVIDPFVDRCFGHHLDPAKAEDLAFIDRVHARDDAAMRSGEIKPTHVIAVMSKSAQEPCRFVQPFSPQFCLRVPT